MSEPGSSVIVGRSRNEYGPPTSLVDRDLRMCTDGDRVSNSSSASFNCPLFPLRLLYRHRRDDFRCDQSEISALIGTNQIGTWASFVKTQPNPGHTDGEL